MKRIFSGIQPTGVLHLGNYLGTVVNWKELSLNNDVLYSIVDLHALTTSPTNKTLSKSSYNMLAMLLSCGISSKNLFIQSHNGIYHTELSWLLSCYCPKSWLNHMIQYKEKKIKILIHLLVYILILYYKQLIYYYIKQI